MNKEIKISKDKYYKAILSVINCFLNLTDYELELVVNMLNHNIKTLTTETRAQLRTLTKSNVHSFNNYIKRLKDKEVLIETSYGLGLNPNITNSIADKEVNIKFKITEDVNQNINSQISA